MNLISYIILAIVAAAVVTAALHIWHRRHNPQCGGGCSGCAFKDNCHNG
ncbi:MAG: FeoB-associated Cys-rich membrane protein [Bacteroidales bacterium]|nr:FeoB-associated Cys-rich membrane protein [Bacteroidales bacterium]